MNSRIKVLHLIKSLGRGGAEMLLPETLRLHDQEQFEFHYAYFLPWKDQMVESIRSHGGRVTCFSASHNVALMAKAGAVVKYVSENKIDVIHAHLPWAGILARIVGKICKVPVIYTEHNKQERYHFGTRWMNLLTMNLLTEVVAVSADVESSIRKYKPKLKPRLRTILNGVNTDHFHLAKFNRMEIRQQLKIPADAPVIGTIAVFRFQKRLDVWMDVAAGILKRFPDAHFIVVGAGPLLRELEEKRRSLGLTERLHLPGLQTEVRPFLAAFDIYMMSSIFEGLPIALLEAMSMECAIVTTDAGGIKEVVRDGVDGLVCSVDRPDDLETLTEALLSDLTRRKKLAENARSRVANFFSLHKMVGELETLYKATANSRAA